MFWDRTGVDWKEGDCQVICGRVRSEGFLCRDKFKIVMILVTETEIS